MKKYSLWLAVTSLLLALSVNSAHAFSCADTTTTGIPQIECEALVALYDSTNGAGWKTNTHWKTATAVSNWHGVTVTDGHVNRLILTNHQLSGMLPAELSDLAHLEILRLSGNQLSGAIPAELSNLANLWYLGLGGNQFSGVIPPELGSLTSLTGLYLYNNQLSGTIPIELSNLVNLTFLNLFGNQLSGSIPPELGNLTQLQYFYLENNQLSGTIPPELGNLGQLQYFNLYRNQFSGPIPVELGDLTSLKNLNLSYNRFSGAIPPELGQLVNLQILHLHANQLSGTIPPELGNLVSASNIRLNGNQLSGTIPPELGNLDNLWYLFLSSNQLSGSIPPELGNMTNLKRLELSENQLTETIPTELSNLAHLEYLYLNNNLLTGDSPDASLTTLLKNLLRLSIRYNCLHPTDPTVSATLYSKDPYWSNNQTHCPIAFNGCNAVTDIPSSECDALVSLYDSTNGGNWINNSNWKQTETPCDWYGITCSNGHVERINMTTNGLSGTLPDLALPYLTMLELAGNNLTGTVPSLADATALVELNLGANQLSGLLPNFALQHLDALFLENNQLSGLIPTFADLPALSTLSISGNTLCVDSALDYAQWATQVNVYPECQMTLKVTKRNTGQGRVTTNEGSIDCDVECYTQKVSYDGLAQAPLITLTATPAAGSVFVEWRADCQGNQPTTQVTVDQAKLCVAEFGADSGNTLSVVKTGEGSGRVRSTTPVNTIYCTQSCLQDSATFDAGVVVTLMATAESGTYFETWSGDCSGTEPTITLTMDANKDCEAKFALISPPPAGMYKLTVQVNGNMATDSVTSTYPRGINCPDNCAENYSAGQRVNLKGFPHSSSEFLGWRGDCRASTLPKGFVIMDGDKTCIADFASQ